MSKLDFNNTEIAFASKSNQQLRQGHFIFKMMNSKSIVKIGSGLAKFGLNIGLPIKGLIRKTVYEQFCGGDSIDDCEDRIKELHQYNIGAILDYSVEGQEDENLFDGIAEEIKKTIRLAKDQDCIPFSVFKVTGMARNVILYKQSMGKDLSKNEQAEWQRTKDRIDSLCALAAEIEQPLFIDAEESWFQNAVDEVVEEMMEKYNQKEGLIFNTIQLYRHDRLDYLKALYQRAREKNYFLGIKLVRGAYLEKERERAQEMRYISPIQATKEDTDRDYNLSLKFCLEHLEYINLCAGTHNEKSAEYLVSMMEEKGIPKNHKHINFSQLLGMSNHISFNLSNAGYNVSKYVPYGPVKDVLPYLIRRAEENSSISGQMSRELNLIDLEMNRRKLH